MSTRNGCTLQHFMAYPYFAFNLAMVVPFDDSVINGTANTAATSRLTDNFKRCWFIVGAFNMIYQIFGMVIYLFTITPEDDNAVAEPLLGQISETGGVLGLWLVGVCKMFILFWHGARITALLQELQQLLPTTEQQERSERMQRGVHSRLRTGHFSHTSNDLMKWTAIFFLFAVSVYNFQCVFDLVYITLSSKGHSISAAIKERYRYQSNTWYPWQLHGHQESINGFMAAYLCQFLSSMTCVAFIMGGEFMLCFFITQMRLHFDYLRSALSTLDATAPNANAQLKYLIHYHSRLLRFSKEINVIFDVSVLVNFFTSTIAICLMAFSMVMISPAHAFRYSVGLMSFLVFTLFICYNGSEFTEASDQLAPAAFSSNWFEGDVQYRKMLLFFIMRASKPNVLEAYKFTTASMVTYMTLLRMSYSLFAFFRTME